MLRQSILFILIWLIFSKIPAPGELIARQLVTAQILLPLQDLGNIVMLYREADASLQAWDALKQRTLETLDSLTEDEITETVKEVSLSSASRS